MKFRVEVEIGNESIKAPSDVARVLSRLAAVLRIQKDTEFNPDIYWFSEIKDNDNQKVGHWKLIDD